MALKTAVNLVDGAQVAHGPANYARRFGGPGKAPCARSSNAFIVMFFI